ncbi:glucose-1-phosphate thymidylyltransferase [Paenibacillus baekrokdamisoli]|uniref:Glucose-1-phosphate thymidylyltransferase n=1 Tax=Paenibacillus baekrokdamisoli TaxID=1712516 RepID=A0A3G9JDL0_9BACL|nr:sugar phosphate nucleotidyltransferase [Paenibacillus baekrokdamisoli]MBB3070076.1 glucose-1-phosphate thymidylyltransferase [Paenibacillus baekrokdamisoli]BBH21089.1 glucose-1-phosphate thymidylyltransferase [Paenibacillus baekrokdamisoli]
MKGLILCAGKGTRLQPFSNHKPKVLLPVANKPIIYTCIEKLIELDIYEIGIVIRPDHAAMFMEEVGAGERWGVRITYIYQNVSLGIADAVRHAETYLNNESFLLLLGDNLIMQSLEGLSHAILQENHEAAILLGIVSNPRDFGIAEVQEDRIIGLEEKPAVPKSNLAVLGAYAFKPDIFKAIHSISPSARGEYEITDAIQWMINSGYSVACQKTEKHYSDVGTMERWLEANQWMLQLMDDAGLLHIHERYKGSTIIPPVLIDPSTEIIDCIIGPYVTIGPDAKLVKCTIENSILLEGVQLTNRVGTMMSHSIISTQSVYNPYTRGSNG